MSGKFLGQVGSSYRLSCNLFVFNIFIIHPFLIPFDLEINKKIVSKTYKYKIAMLFHYVLAEKFNSACNGSLELGDVSSSKRGEITAAGQLRPLRHNIYRGAVVGVRGAAVGARGAVVGVRGAAVGNIGMHTYNIRHICAPVHVREILQQYI